MIRIRSSHTESRRIPSSSSILSEPVTQLTLSKKGTCNLTLTNFNKETTDMKDKSSLNKMIQIKNKISSQSTTKIQKSKKTVSYALKRSIQINPSRTKLTRATSLWLMRKWSKINKKTLLTYTTNNRSSINHSTARKEMKLTRVLSLEMLAKTYLFKT